MFMQTYHKSILYNKMSYYEPVTKRIRDFYNLKKDFLLDKLRYSGKKNFFVINSQNLGLNSLKNENT
jgi:hypothetical protein